MKLVIEPETCSEQPTTTTILVERHECSELSCL
jgi:hypothetical protein